MTTCHSSVGNYTLKNTFSKEAELYSQWWCMSILIPLCPHQHLVWSLFLILVIVIGIYIYIAVFHCGFYLNFSREYWWGASLQCLLAICISLMKCPSFKSFSIFKLNFLIVWFFSSPLSDMWFAEIFFESVACLFLPSQLCLLKYRSFKFWLSAKYQYFLLWVLVLV